MARKLTEEKLQAELSRLEQMKEYEYTYAACPDVYKRHYPISCRTYLKTLEERADFLRRT